MIRSIICSFIAVAFAVTTIPAARAQALSHLGAHVAVESISHLNAHRPGLPPEALLVPLGNGMAGVIKGVTVAEEARLVDALAREQLTQSVLRVASARVNGMNMALVKLQAGDPSGEFAVADLQNDATAALRAAFSRGPGFDHLDLWSVVPGAAMVGELQEHHPVFSLSVSREDYEAAVADSEDGDVLARIPGVRYSPVFLRHAVDADASLPATAFTDPPLAENWEALLAEARGQSVQSRIAAQREIEAIFEGHRDQRYVALTIDDGPHPLVTPLMLEILEQKGVQATFFVVGQKVEQFPGLALATVEGGHELANHAYSNRRMSELPAEEVWSEIAACDRVVQRVTGQKMRWFRPPGGRCSPDGLRALASLGYAAAFWSQNTGDWRKPSPDAIVRAATTGLQGGDVILMHQGDICSVHALPEIIDRIRALGLEPTTLSALARHGGTVRDDPVYVSSLVNGQLGEE